MKRQLRRSLASRALVPIGIAALVVALVAGAFGLIAVSEFIERQAGNDLHWRSMSVFRIADGNLDELQRTGRTGFEAALRHRKVTALTEIEDFARVNGLRITVRDGSSTGPSVMELGPPIEPRGLASASLIDRLLPSTSRVREQTVRFEPWQWEITVQQDDHAYRTLLHELLIDAGVFALLLVIGISAIMAYLSVLTRKPVRQIIDDLEHNREPTYRGIEEFEYLSQSVSSMMHAINEQSAQLQAQLTEVAFAKEAADVANRAKSTFVTGMSHELRTPLTSILGYAQILQRDKELNPKQLAALATIEKSGHHLLALIDDILDLSKIEAGKLELHLAPITLAPFLRSIVDIVRVRAEKKQLAFVYDAPELPETVLADERQLRQVLLNLLGNAIKFTDSGRVALRVECLARADDAWTMRLEVADSGVGIAEDDLRTLFQPFHQVGDMERRHGGTGLGLAISQQLVQLMGGHIQVDSVAGEGSRFRFDLRLPLARPQLPIVAQRIATGYDGPRKKVLIVDDVHENRMVLTDMLRPLGFITFEACNGQDGLDKARQVMPDLILMDNVMPVMDGLQTTRRLRELPALKDIPVLALSASATEADRDNAVAAGANDFLPKPLRTPELLAMLERHLGIRFHTH